MREVRQYLPVAMSGMVSTKSVKAPVALFVYNRAAQVGRVLDCLRQNHISKLYVFCDGPKNREDLSRVSEVRKVVHSIRWIEPEVFERSVNQGIRESMLLGLELVFANEERVIVIEDDVAVAPEFCDFMNECLERYQGEERVAGVTGLRYPFDRSVFEGFPYDAYFSARFSSWGWGTWKRWWETIDFDHERAIEWLSKTNDEELKIAGNDVPEMARCLRESGLSFGTTTADVYSLLHMIRNRQFFVCPTWNMVENLGLSEGTHASGSTQNWSLAWEMKSNFSPEGLRLPGDIDVSASIWKAFESFLDSTRTVGEPTRTVEKELIAKRSASEIAKLIVRNVTPPVVLRLGRALLKQLR